MLESDNGSGSPTQCSKSDYAISCGSSNAANELGSNVTTLSQGDTTTTWYEAASNWNGISFQRSEVSPALIFDGLSNTILIGEKEVDPNHYTDGSTSCDNHCVLAGLDNDMYRTETLPPLQDTPGNASTVQFGSAHSGLCMFVFCDGSVHKINNDIDANTFANLGSRNDGQAIDGSKF